MLRMRVAAALAGLLCLAGPSLIQGGSIQGGSIGAASAQELAGTLKAVKEAGAITLGYRESSIPFSFLNVRKHPIGYSMDLCQAIVEAAQTELEQELTVKFKPVTSESRIPALVAGEIDLECGSTTNNLERRKRVEFSPMIFVSGTKVMVPVATPWRDFRDLKGRKVAVTRGTTNAQALEALDRKFGLGITLIEGADHEDSYRLLAEGKVDAFATDDVLLYGLIAQHRAQSQFKVVGEFLSYDPYGIAFRRNEPALRDAVERAIRNLVVARDIGPIYAKWFESRLPNGERFNIPMSPQLEESFAVLGATGEAN